jgi:MinD-like ATPase involved in chromosome partitioning or flagellar assembly
VSASYPLLVAVTGAAEARLVAAVESQPELAVVRRCVDLAEVLALAATGRAAAALVSLDLRRLDRDAVARLRADRVAVVAVVTEAQQPRAQALGITATVADDADGASLLAAVVAATESPVPPPVWGNADPASELDRQDSAFDRRAETAPPARPAPARGRLIAVWGPPGAPGRTTVAVSLAAELAAAGHWTLLADADSYAASIAQVLGVLDEAPGLAAACRAAAAGSLDRLGLARLAPLVSANLRILTGISRADRWPELSAGTLEEVWTVARSLCRWTVADLASCLERDEELSYDTAAPRRNAATLATLECADRIVVVGAADPVGLQRLVRGLGELREVVDRELTVVVTRVRASAVGDRPEAAVRQALSRHAGLSSVVVVPDARDTLDAALLAGRTVVEFAPASPVRAAIAELAAVLTH